MARSQPDPVPEMLDRGHFTAMARSPRRQISQRGKQRLESAPTILFSGRKILSGERLAPISSEPNHPEAVHVKRVPIQANTDGVGSFHIARRIFV